MRPDQKLKAALSAFDEYRRGYRTGSASYRAAVERIAASDDPWKDTERFLAEPVRDHISELSHRIQRIGKASLNEHGRVGVSGVDELERLFRKRETRVTYDHEQYLASVERDCWRCNGLELATFVTRGLGLFWIDGFDLVTGEWQTSRARKYFSAMPQYA